MAEIKCLNYFTYQFLVEKDFKDEQTYHRDMRRRHNRVFHSWGVAEGLVVTKTGDKQVSISPGTAIDKDGREIVLPSEPSPPPIDLTVFGTDVDVFLTIVYQEVFDEADRYTSGSVDNYTRTTERPKLEGTTNVPPGDGSVIALARVHLDDTGNVAEIDNSVRTPVGSKVTPESVSTDELASGAVTEPKMANNAVSNRTIEDSAVSETKLDTATRGKLVTNGNKHDHSGGDGAPIRHSTLVKDDGTNPHGTTAADVGALASLEGVSNPGGNVDLVPDGVVTITPDDTNNRITIGADALPTSGGTLNGHLRVNGNIGIGGASPIHRLHAFASDEPGHQTLGIVSNAQTGSATNYTNAMRAQANSSGDGEVVGLSAFAGGDGTGMKEGVSSSVSGGGPKYAGLFNAYSGEGSDVTQALYGSASSSGDGTVQGLSAFAGGDGTGDKRGVFSSVSGGGHKYAGSFYAYSGEGSDVTQALYGSANSSGDGSVVGLSASAGGDGTGMKQGVSSSVSGGGHKYGGRFYATSGEGSDVTRALSGYASSAGTGIVRGLEVTAGGSGTGNKYAVYAQVTGGGTKFAGYFQGNVHVNGSLSKSAGTFLIDHPLDPYNKTLRHNFVESPENLCLYRGKVKLDAQGQATVKMPEYFAALTNEAEATINLTPIGKKPFLASYEWNEEATAFSIYGDAGREVAYMVLADRDDPVIHNLRRPVEEEKGNGNFEKGRLLNPEAYGKPLEMREGFEREEEPFQIEKPVPREEDIKKIEEELKRCQEEHKKFWNEQQQIEEKLRQKEIPRPPKG